MVALLIAVNYFSFNHYARADFSRSQKFVLSDQTKRVLRELKKPVQVTVFFSPTVLSPETGLFPDVQNLLKESIFRAGTRSKSSMSILLAIFPGRGNCRSNTSSVSPRTSSSWTTMVARSLCLCQEMADFDMSPVESGDPPRLLTFKGEQALTNAMIALVSPERLKVYFLQGHGEPGIGEMTPLSVFKDYIERQNVTVAPLSFASLDAVPADCATLIIVAPQFDIEEREAAILEKFWKEKGRLLVARPETQNATADFVAQSSRSDPAG